LDDKAIVEMSNTKEIQDSVPRSFEEQKEIDRNERLKQEDVQIRNRNRRNGTQLLLPENTSNLNGDISDEVHEYKPMDSEDEEPILIKDIYTVSNTKEFISPHDPES